MSSQSIPAGAPLPEGILSIPARAGDARWWFGALAEIKLGGAETGGKFSLIEVLLPSNLEVPLHIHDREDEVFHVLEGRISYRIGDSRFDATAGHTLFGPKGIPHGFIGVSDEPARYLIIYSPAGFEEFIRESSVPAPEFTLPPNPPGPPDPATVERLGALTAKYGCRFV
jgi:quercetin dioxygenase-like cupin family protein